MSDQEKKSQNTNVIKITSKYISKSGEWLVIKVADNSILIRLSEVLEMQKEKKSKGA